MSYLRANGRVQGRVSGRWGRASVSGQYQLGDVAIPGDSVELSGDPVMALIAQLNRFSGGKTFTLNGCSARHFVNAPFPMSPVLTDAAATAAVLIVSSRYTCGPIDTLDAKKAAWANAGLTGDSRAWALTNIREIVVTIAQFGDSLGLPPASYGITKADPKFRKKLDTTQVVLLGGVALAAVVLLTRRK